MTKDQLHEMIMGAAVVALIYAFYRHAKTAAASVPAPVFTVNNPINQITPQEGTSYDPANPGAYIPLTSLLNGTVHDIATGNTQNYVSTADVTTQALLDLYNVPDNGKISQNSVVFVPGANYGYVGSAGP